MSNTTTPETWADASVDSKINSSGLFSSLYFEIPLNPLIQPLTVLPSLSVYVIISSPTFNKPYSSGKPSELDNTISVSVDVHALSKIMSGLITLSTRLSNLMYWSKFSARSIAPPWNSWEM